MRLFAVGTARICHSLKQVNLTSQYLTIFKLILTTTLTTMTVTFFDLLLMIKSVLTALQHSNTVKTHYHNTCLFLKILLQIN